MFPSRRITTMGGDVFRDEYSLAFDGGDAEIVIGETNDLSPSSITVSAWLKFNGSAPAEAYPRIIDADGDSKSFHLRYGRDNNLFCLRVSDDGTNHELGNTDSTYTDYNKWYHVVGTYNHTTGDVKMYVDGVHDGTDNLTGAGALNNPSGDIIIGAQAGGNDNWWRGNISEIAVYDTDLSASQVKTLYNGREPYNHKEGIATSNLISWWRMGDGIYDQKGTEDADGGIICDMNDVSLGSDVFGGKGDFSDASYWTLDGGSADTTIEGGLLKWADDGDTYAECKKLSVLTVGKMYRIDITVDRNDGARMILNEGDPYIRVSETLGATGTFTAYWRASNTAFRLYRNNPIGDDDYDKVVHVSNLVVREVTGGHHGQMVAMNPVDFTGDTP